MVVYKIYNDVNSKLYIGITTKSLEARWKQHLSKCKRGVDTHLYCAMRKYGIDKFHIIQIDSAETLEELKEKEKYYVKLYNSLIEGYNMTPGGDSNPMDVSKIQLKHDAKMQSPEIKEKISNTMKQKSFSEEHKKNLSLAAFKRYGNTSLMKKKDFYSKKSITTSVIKNDGPTHGKKVLYDLEGKKRYVNPELVEDLVKSGWTYPTNKKKVPLEEQNPNQLHTYQRHKSQEEVHNNLSISHLGHIPSNKGVPCSEEKKQKCRDAILGRRWVNNGEIQKQVKQEELDYYLNNGFVLGILKRR